MAAALERGDQFPFLIAVERGDERPLLGAADAVPFERLDRVEQDCVAAGDMFGNQRANAKLDLGAAVEPIHSGMVDNSGEQIVRMRVIAPRAAKLGFKRIDQSVEFVGLRVGGLGWWCRLFRRRVVRRRCDLGRNILRLIFRQLVAGHLQRPFIRLA